MPHERARRAAAIFTEAEIAAEATTLGPLASRALELGLEAWEEICWHLERGDIPRAKEIDGTLNALNDALIAIPEFRWQEFRSCVRRIMGEIGDDRAMIRPDIRNIKDIPLLEGQCLRETFEDEAPAEIRPERSPAARESPAAPGQTHRRKKAGARLTAREAGQATVPRTPTGVPELQAERPRLLRNAGGESRQQAGHRKVPGGGGRPAEGLDLGRL